jgi:hypothetical protein
MAAPIKNHQHSYFILGLCYKKLVKSDKNPLLDLSSGLSSMAVPAKTRQQFQKVAR